MTKISNPFAPTIHRTERTANQILVEWINNIVKEKNIPLGRAEQETSGADRKQPDVILFERPQSQKVLCVIELKPPCFNPFNENELLEPARKKASKRRAPYFCTSNFKDLIWFNTKKANDLKPLQEQIIEKYQLSGIEDLDYLQRPNIKHSIIKSLEKFLIDLYEVHTKKKKISKIPIDELLIYLLQQKIKVLATHYEYIIEERVINDLDFSKKLQKWFVDQNWNFVFQKQDFQKAARQTAYLLINKILFYNVLRAKRPQDLDPLEIPESLTKGSRLQSELQSYFNEVLKIDYETIYTTDFIDEIAFPEILNVVEEIKELILTLARYNFASLGFEVIGRIFESLIPAEERHVLGQYFTRSDIVDLILRFCLRNEKDKVFDPGCGAGTFLVRAYQHKKIMNQSLEHEEILKTLWGNDIAKFPTHLTTINLAINDLSSNENYPRVIKKDFFELLPGKVEFNLPDSWREIKLEGLGKVHKKIEHPRFFDCIVGNPPYTRQEEIADIEGKSDAEYKTKLIQSALNDISGRKIATISKRAGLYAYFFVHGFKFLKNGGRFGFIVSNSWLDVDYGKGLQEFFLKNYKIIAIIESKVERWFAEADVNTCIVILEKCSGEQNKKRRDENLARFVYLKKPLTEFIPPAHNMWEKQVKRLHKIDDLIKTILAHNKFYKNENLRIFSKKQKELWEEGFDKEKNKYVGAKWGKYLRAPEIFFKILEKAKNKLVPLKEIADVRFGIKTGANDFFHLTDEQIKKWRIEKKFWMHKENNKFRPNYVLTSARENDSIVVNPKRLKKIILMVHEEKRKLKGKKVLDYINLGESKTFGKGKKAGIPSQKPTCSSRKNWYDLGYKKPGDAFWMMTPGNRYIVFYNARCVYADARLYDIYFKEKADVKAYVAFLNSSIIPLFTGQEGRFLTGSINVIDVKVYEFLRFLVPNFNQVDKAIKSKLEKAFEAISQRKIETILKEIGATKPSEVSLNKVKLDRRILDRIIMEDILKLNKNEQLEIYRAVVDLISSRIKKAKSVSKKNKTKEGIDIDKLTQTVMKKISPKTLGKFYKEKALSQKHYFKKLPPKGKNIRIDQTLMEWLLISDKKHISCTSEEQARYLKIWLETGLEEVAIPNNDNYLKLILPELEKLFKKIERIIDSFIYSIVDQKTRQRVLQKLWQEATKY